MTLDLTQHAPPAPSYGLEWSDAYWNVGSWATWADLAVIAVFCLLVSVPYIKAQRAKKRREWRE